MTEQGLINLTKLVEQQKLQRVKNIKTKFLKQSHDSKLAENLSTIAKQLELVDKSSKDLRKNLKNHNLN